MASARIRDLDHYDLIQLSLTCVSGLERKMLVPAQHLKQILQNTGTISFGPIDIPQNTLLFDATSSMGEAKIDSASIRRLPWLCTNGKEVGGATCELIAPTDQSHRILSPRTAAMKQVQRLKEEFGLTLKSAHEAEFMIFESDEVTPFNKVDILQCGRYDMASGREDVILEAAHSVEEAGLPLESFMTEFWKCQFEMTFRPEEGVASADTVMIMKEAVRAVLKKQGLAPTFMSCPVTGGHANGFHFNHSLWTKDDKNAFQDPDKPECVTPLTYHWMAGIIHHMNGLTALFCPTTNCMLRLQDEMSPTFANWGIDNRGACLRLKTGGNTYLESRLPSAMFNPYLALAATLAAGMDGLAKKLECPPEWAPDAAQILTTLGETVSSLKRDDVLAQALGEDLMKAFLANVEKCIKSKPEKGQSELDHQRMIYFDCI